MPDAARTPHGDSAAGPAHSPPTWSFTLCCTQMWMKKTGQPFPPFARTVPEYRDKHIHHPYQMSLARFSAYHFQEIISNLDMLAIARTTKLTATSKEKVEDETSTHVNAPGSLGERVLWRRTSRITRTRRGWCRSVASDVQLIARQIDSYTVQAF